MMVAVSGLWLRREGDELQVLAELSDGWRLVMSVSVDGPYGATADVNDILAAPHADGTRLHVPVDS